MNREETSHQMITNLSTTPVECSHCTFFVWNQHCAYVVAKNRTIQNHRKHLENSMTELSGSIADIFCLLTHYRLLSWRHTDVTVYVYRWTEAGNC